MIGRSPGISFEQRFDVGGVEKQLVLDFKKGQDGAYDAIYQRYLPRVESICKRMLHRPEDAQEAMQEAFLKVYQSLPRFNGRYQLGAWVARITTNVCLDQIRASARKPSDAFPPEIIELECLEVDPGPENIVIRRSESRRVRRVLASLPPMHRAAIVLRDFEGFSYEEVASFLEITDTQVKALIHRARKGFKRSWSQLASLLIPTKLLHKLKLTGTAAGDASGPALGSSAHALSSCSVVLQQCGSLVAERVAPIMVASVVGIAAVGGGTVARGNNGTAVDDPVAASTPEPKQSSPKISSKQAARQERSSTQKSSAGQTAPSDPSQTPSQQPTPAPASSQAPTSGGAPSGPSPQPSPSTSPEQKGGRPAGEETTYPTTHPMVAFDQGQAMTRSVPSSMSNVVDCDGRGLDQTMTTSVSTGNGPRSGKLVLNAGSSIGFELEIEGDGYKVRYIGGGGTIERVRSDRYVRVRYAGSYSTANEWAGAMGLPRSGSFSLYLILDCKDLTLVTEDLVLR